MSCVLSVQCRQQMFLVHTVGAIPKTASTKGRGAPEVGLFVLHLTKAADLFWPVLYCSRGNGDECFVSETQDNKFNLIRSPFTEQQHTPIYFSFYLSLY